MDNPYPTAEGGANVPGFNAISDGRAQLISLALTQSWGASILNEARLSYMRFANNIGQPLGGVGPTLSNTRRQTLTITKRIARRPPHPLRLTEGLPCTPRSLLRIFRFERSRAEARAGGSGGEVSALIAHVTEPDLDAALGLCAGDGACVEF